MIQQPKRFVGLNARERYNKQYREDRVFSSYPDQTWSFPMDTPRVNAYFSYVNRREKFRGWANDARRLKFAKLISERYPLVHIPF